MWITAVAAFAVIGIGAGGALHWARQSSGQQQVARAYAWAKGIDVRRHLRIAMPDGVSLEADLYLPAHGKERVPTILLRTPYERERWLTRQSEVMHFATRGFAVVVQSMRGRFGSDGEFSPYAHSADDGRAVLDWIVAQPWSNGRVGTYGCSALGESQLILGATGHPALKAMVPQSAGGAVGSAGGRYGYFGVFEGGIPLLSSAAGWFFENGARSSASSREQLANPPRGEGPDGALSLQSLPSIDIVRRQSTYDSDYQRLMSLPLNSPQWITLGYLKDGDRFSAPALHVNSWFDQAVSATLFAARFMAEQADSAEARRQPVVIGPGMHCTAGSSRPVGQVGDLKVAGPHQRLFDTYLHWFATWLSDDAPPASREAVDALPPYRFYVMREDRWLDANEWPPKAATNRRFYLHGAGRANSVDGDGRLVAEAPSAEAVDRFTYDPANPVPTRGGTFCCTGDALAREGSVDQRDIERRPDVLVYTSAPLQQPMRITGPVRARLYVSTSAKDTDFTARLVDVAPDGLALNIRDGGLRLRYRDGFDSPAMAVPGQVYRIDIELGDVAWQVPAGHRLRLQVSSSNFPRFERNLNTGGDNARETKPVTAFNEVRHGAGYASWIEFPVWQ